MYPKSVYLDYGSSSNERYVTPEGYEAIKALIQQYQMCGKCKSVIDQGDHLLVGRHLCLSCLLQKQPALRFLGPVEVDNDGDYTYSYIDDDNVVYTSKANSSEAAAKDTYGSIVRSGFEIPQFYVPFKGDKENPIRLGRYNWTVYGSLHQSAIVLEYKDTYPTVHIVFIAYKEGQIVELNKRNLAFKQMFERAKAVVESTKKYGYYHINGYELDRYSDETLYPIIARMEAAVWDVQKAFMPKKADDQQPELTAEPEQPRPALQLVVSEDETQEVEIPEQEAPGEETPAPEEPSEQAQDESTTGSIEPDQATEDFNQTEEIQDQPDQDEEATEITTESQEEPEEQPQTDATIDVQTSRRGRRGRLSVVPKEEVKTQKEATDEQ